MNKLLLLLLGATSLMALSLASLEEESATALSEGVRRPHDSLSIREILRLLVREEQRRGVLEEEGVAVLQRIQERQDLAAQVIARRLTLPEAAARFRSLNAELHEAMLLAAFPGATEEERLRRQVIVWVSNALLDNPAQQTAEVGRLEDELKQYLRGDNRSAPQ